MNRSQVSEEQLQALLSYMEKHTLFARGQIPKLGQQGHIKFKNMWTYLTNLLNGIGPVEKNTSSWQKVKRNYEYVSISFWIQF